jgi:hypothetical protein
MTNSPSEWRAIVMILGGFSAVVGILALFTLIAAA